VLETQVGKWLKEALALSDEDKQTVAAFVREHVKRGSDTNARQDGASWSYW
jgi:hypothetical protein